LLKNEEQFSLRRRCRTLAESGKTEEEEKKKLGMRSRKKSFPKISIRSF
jgi:hypothetical protein